MISSDPKDYYYHVKPNGEIHLLPSQEYENNTGYDASLVKINPILEQHGIHEEAEQMYYTDMTVDDAITTLDHLGFVQNDEFSKMIKKFT